MRLQDELQQYGCLLKPRAFERLLKRVYKTLFLSLTIDNICHHPTKALRYCIQVRKACQVKLPDEMILRRFMNVRKAGRMTAFRRTK